MRDNKERIDTRSVEGPLAILIGQNRCAKFSLYLVIMSHLIIVLLLTINLIPGLNIWRYFFIPFPFNISFYITLAFDAVMLISIHRGSKSKYFSHSEFL